MTEKITTNALQNVLEYIVDTKTTIGDENRGDIDRNNYLKRSIEPIILIIERIFKEQFKVNNMYSIYVIINYYNLLNHTQKKELFMENDFQTLYLKFLEKFRDVFLDHYEKCKSDIFFNNIYTYFTDIDKINQNFVNLVIDNKNVKYYLNIKDDDYINQYINKFNDCLGTQIILLILLYFNIDKIYDKFSIRQRIPNFLTKILFKSKTEILKIRSEIKVLFQTKVSELKNLILKKDIFIDKNDFEILCKNEEIKKDHSTRYTSQRGFNILNTECYLFELQNKPKSSETIESKKNAIKAKIEKIIGEDKKISFENINYNNSLIIYIDEVYNAKFNHNNSIIHEINEGIINHSQYPKITSCIQNQTTNPVYNILLTQDPDTYADLSQSNIGELKKLLSEYNELLQKQLSNPVATEPPLTLTNNQSLTGSIGSIGLTGFAGGSKNLRHSIDLIIQLFKKQRPSLNINPDLLYNCVVSSSKKNNKKPLRKYNNQRTKK
jgi:hypothetical protein